MATSVNRLSVPEIADYARTVADGLVIVRYRVRQPGETAWTVVRIVRAER